MKKTAIISLLLFSHLSVAQQISCESVTTSSPSINYPEHVVFNMTSANTEFIFMAKPKGFMRFTTMALGNGTTNIPDNYAPVRKPEYDDGEWEAWSTGQILTHTNRTSFHVVGYGVSGINVGNNYLIGDTINLYVKGLPSNNTYSPSGTLISHTTAVQYKKSADFNDVVIVDDIIAGEEITVSLGRITRGVVDILLGSGTFIGGGAGRLLSTSNENVNIELTANGGNVYGIYGSKNGTFAGDKASPYVDDGVPVELLATIQPNENASGEYTQTFTFTVTCP